MTTDQPQGYLAAPDSSDAQPVLVLHAWWGLNETIKAFCDNLANEGFLAFAPDLYHGELTDTIEGAEKLAGALDARYEEAQAEVAQAARYLEGQSSASEEGVAVVGFSLGAAYALQLAAAEPDLVDKVVLYYGVGPAEQANARARYLGHFAENDPYETPENVQWLRDGLQHAGRPVTFYTYEGVGHWFAEPDREDAYDAPAAQLAWARTLDFLRGVEEV